MQCYRAQHQTGPETVNFTATFGLDYLNSRRRMSLRLYTREVTINVRPVEILVIELWGYSIHMNFSKRNIGCEDVA